jgi:hypothetical protein
MRQLRQYFYGALLAPFFAGPVLAQCMTEELADGFTEYDCGGVTYLSATPAGGSNAPGCGNHGPDDPCSTTPQAPIIDGGRTDALGVAAGVAAVGAAATGNPEAGMAAAALGLGAAVSSAADNGSIGISPQSVTSAPDSPGIGPGPSADGGDDGE